MKAFFQSQRELSAAQGYFELGMIEEALDQLESIPASDQGSPLVAEFRVALYTSLKRWERVEEICADLAQTRPEEVGWWISWAYATRRLRSVLKANEILLRAEKHHSDQPVIHFNLACYACQLGQKTQALQRLKTAFALDADYRLTALKDADLEPIWPDIPAA